MHLYYEVKVTSVKYTNRTQMEIINLVADVSLPNRQHHAVVFMEANLCHVITISKMAILICL